MRIVLFETSEDCLNYTGQTSLKIIWQGRGSSNIFLSLEEELEKRLVRIRSLHMNWAYESGFLVTGPGRTLQEEFVCEEEPSMWWTSLIYERHPKLSPELFPIYKIFCLEEILVEKKCTELIVKKCSKKLRAALKQICDDYSWKIEFIDKPSEKKFFFNLRKMYFLLPPFIRALTRLVHWQYCIQKKITQNEKRNSIWKNNLEQAKRLGITPATIITYFPNIDLEAAGHGRFISRYWEKLHELLNQEANKNSRDNTHFVRWLFIRFPAPGLSLKQCLDLRNVFNKNARDGLTFNYLEEFLTPKDILSSLKRWWKIQKKQKSLQKVFSSNCVFPDHIFNFWNFIKEQWKESFAGWRCLERCIQNRAFKNYFLSAGKQRWILFPLENCPWERMSTVAARETFPDQPVYGSQHSIIRPTDFRYFDAPATFYNSVCKKFQPDVVGGNGEDACSQLLQNNIPDKILWQLEALRYLYLAKYNPVLPVNSKLPPQEGEPAETISSDSIILLTGFFKDETDAQLLLLKECIKDGLFEKWNITIKPHPYLPVENWINLILAETSKKIQVFYGALEQAFLSGNIVWTSNSTTACLDAILRKKPVMVMKPYGDFDLCPLQNLKELWRTGDLNDVKTGLANVKPINLPKDYLDLNQNLDAWKKLLKI